MSLTTNRPGLSVVLIWEMGFPSRARTAIVAPATGLPFREACGTCSSSAGRREARQVAIFQIATDAERLCSLKQLFVAMI